MARLILIAILASAFSAWAGEADVLSAKVTKSGSGTYNFDVTIRSNDRGWDYFCDRFEVLTPDGKVLGVRTLLHPHETEQPFTGQYSCRVERSPHPRPPQAEGVRREDHYRHTSVNG